MPTGGSRRSPPRSEVEQTHEAQMVVYPQDAAARDRAFPITVTARYRNRLGEDKHTADHAWTVGLYRDEEFQPWRTRMHPLRREGRSTIRRCSSDGTSF